MGVSYEQINQIIIDKGYNLLSWLLCHNKHDLLPVGKLVNYQDSSLPLWQEWRVSLETDTL